MRFHQAAFETAKGFEKVWKVFKDLRVFKLLRNPFEKNYNL